MPPLTQNELVEEAARRAAALHSGKDGSRVTERTIRFYRSQSILDPPSGWQGNRPLFGDRHVWQLLAVRVLQSSGWTLQQIRDWLHGADDATLKRLVTSPGSIEKITPPPVPRQQQVGEARASTRYWKSGALAAASQSNAFVTENTGDTLTTTRVAPGVYVMVDREAAGHLSPDEIATAARRIRRLLHELEAPGESDREPDE